MYQIIRYKRAMWLWIIPMLIIMLVTSLSGCSNKSKTNTGKDKGVSTSEDISKYFEGKIINFIVPYSAGGGYDIYARLIQPYLQKYTGATVVVRNIEGGGGLVGDAEVYKSKPDGLTIGIMQGGAPLLNQILGEPLPFDPSRLTYLLRVASEPRVLAVSAKSPYRNVNDLKNSSRPIRFGTLGAKGNIFYQTLMIGRALGLEDRMQVVTAYEGNSEVALALVRGEIDAELASYTSIKSILDSGDAIPIIQFADKRAPELPEVPLVSEIEGLTDEGRELLKIVGYLNDLDRTVIAPPDLPQDIAKELETVFLKALNDPELLATASQRQMLIDPIGSEETRERVNAVLNMPEQMRNAFIGVVRRFTK